MANPHPTRSRFSGGRRLPSRKARSTRALLILFGQLAGIYERLGTTDEMKAKTKAQPAPKQIVEAVANGDAELAVFVLNLLIDPRLDIVGPFPAEVQREVVYAAGVAANSKEPEAAKAFVAYLISPPAIAAIKAKGMNPG
jgi:molybdate transport system substrate-binding protein